MSLLWSCRLLGFCIFLILMLLTKRSFLACFYFPRKWILLRKRYFTHNKFCFMFSFRMEHDHFFHIGFNRLIFSSILITSFATWWSLNFLLFYFVYPSLTVTILLLKRSFTRRDTFIRFFCHWFCLIMSSYRKTPRSILFTWKQFRCHIMILLYFDHRLQIMWASN